MKTPTPALRGRFAPSPTGRMHLGNIWTALLSYLSVKSRGGVWVLRHEDLDPQRSRREYARLIEDDLLWLGLEPDEGGLDDNGIYAPYLQSCREEIYAGMLERLRTTGWLYGCKCRRADLLSASAPHASDGRPVYAGTCRPSTLPEMRPLSGNVAIRIAVRDEDITVEDMHFGPRTYNLKKECGDFVVRRSDGAYSYQLAVVADDAAMQITEVVRGCDLLPSAAQQMYLYRLMGGPPPRFCHIPLLCNKAGQRLSKRDSALSMEALRQQYSPGEIIGKLAHLAHLIPEPESCTPRQLLNGLNLKKLPAVEGLISPEF